MFLPDKNKHSTITIQSRTNFPVCYVCGSHCVSLWIYLFQTHVPLYPLVWVTNTQIIRTNTNFRMFFWSFATFGGPNMWWTHTNLSPTTSLMDTCDRWSMTHSLTFFVVVFRIIDQQHSVFTQLALVHSQHTMYRFTWSDLERGQDTRFNDSYSGSPTKVVKSFCHLALGHIQDTRVSQL